MTIVACILLTSSTAPAFAHGDDIVAETLVTLAPGGHHDIPLDVHWHRLLGRVDADIPVSVALVRPRLPGRFGATTLDRAPARTHRFQHMIRCCRDQPWTAFAVRLANRGAEPARVRLALVLVHDDLAVTVDRAEGGTRGSFVVLSGLLVFGMWRGRRRPSVGLGQAAAILGVASAVIVAVSLIGWIRHDVGGAPSVLAGAMDLPLFPANPIVSRATLLLFVAIVAWGIAVVRWSRARAAHGTWLLMAGALVGAVAAVAVAVSLSYDTVGLPLLASVASAGPVLARVPWGPAAPPGSG